MYRQNPIAIRPTGERETSFAKSSERGGRIDSQKIQTSPGTMFPALKLSSADANDNGEIARVGKQTDERTDILTSPGMIIVLFDTSIFHTAWHSRRGLITLEAYPAAV